MDQWKATIINFLTLYGFQVVGALVILAIGWIVARWTGRLTQRWLEKHQLEPPIRTLMVRVVTLLVFALAVVLALDKFGVQIAPLIAGIGVAGVGIGLALQGVLGNLMAGLTIILTKPYRIGEYIDIVGAYGQVTNIELFSTTLLHADRSRVIIPNRKIVGEILHNYGALRQLDLKVGVGYGTDLATVFGTVREILNRDPRVLKEPAPVVGINALEDSSISISVKPWVKVPDFTEAQLELYKAIVEQFRGRQIEIPFPQREVRLLNPVSPPNA